MLDIEIFPCFESDTRRKYVAAGPIDFETWLQLSHDFDTELVQGVMVDRMAAQYPHEWIFAWLFRLLGDYTEERNLGKVLGSRTAIKISDHDGRLPDILFVRADNTDIIQKNAIYGVPDLVIEIVSENDYPYILVPLEADYRSIGVTEIVFLDPKKKRVRCLRKTEDDYVETLLTIGRLTFSCIPGFWVEVEWLFAEEKPKVTKVLKQLIEAAEAGDK